jgi:two-component system, NarL family, sensor kinase
MQEDFNSDLISIAVSFILFFLMVFFVVIGLAVRYRKRKKENEILRAQFSEQLLKSRLEIQEQTLQHVSRELHDNIGQMASLIKINLNTIQLQQPAIAETKLENTKVLTRQLITDLKLLSTSLNTDKISRLGLMRALQNEADNLERTGVFKAEFIQHNDVPAITDEKTIILFRMAQEIINNSLKHAEASEIIIQVQYEKNQFTLMITDNGQGFDVNEKIADLSDGGNGLINLRQRAKVIHAHLAFNSAPGKGTETIISMAL